MIRPSPCFSSSGSPPKRDTVKLSRELDRFQANDFTYLPLPGTASHARLVADGEIEKVDWDHFLLMTAAYVPKGMTRKERMAATRLAFLRFHLRPRIGIRILRAVRSWRHFKFLARRFYHWVLMTPNPAQGQIKDQRSRLSKFKARVAGLLAERSVPTMPQPLDRASTPAAANMASLVPPTVIGVGSSANPPGPAATRDQTTPATADEPEDNPTDPTDAVDPADKAYADLSLPVLNI